MVLLPGVPEALSALADAGYRLVVITNQSGVARGLYTHAEARATGLRLAALLQPHGIRLAGHYHCPHHFDGSVPHLTGLCDCRKPSPGMLLRAAEDLGLDLPRSWTVGDMLSDVGAGMAAGTRTVFIDNGSLALPPEVDPPPIVARNVAHAAMIALVADGHLAPDLELADAAAACPGRVLHRPATPQDSKAPGVPSQYPDGLRMRQARLDANLLARAVGRSSRAGL